MAHVKSPSGTRLKEDPTKRKRPKSQYPYVPKGPPLELPPCKVCGGKASGIHYGVNSCEACKGFFRRYLMRGEPYKCTYGGNCEISDRHRGNCSACRMQKCLDLGMSKESIRQGRYTLTERTKTIIEVKKLQLQSDIQTQPEDPNKNLDFISTEVTQKSSEKSNSPLLPSPVIMEPNLCSDFPQFSPELNREFPFSIDGMELVIPQQSENEDTCSLVPPELQTLPSDMTGSSSSDSMVLNSPFNFSAELAESATNVLDTFEDTIVKLLEGLDEVRPHANLSDAEIYAILKEGHDKYNLRAQVFGPLNALSPEEYNDIYEKTNLDVDGRKGYLQKNRGTIEVVIKKYVNFSHKIPGFSELPANDQASLLKASRFEFFLLLEYRALDPDLEMMLTYTGEVFHLNEACIYVPKEMMKSWLEFTRCIRKLELTNAELAVVLAISLTFRDRCKLNSPDEVERIQIYLTRILDKLLQDHHGDTYQAWFTQVKDMFMSFRPLSETYFQHFRNTIQHCQLIREQMPEILEFAFDECKLEDPDGVESIQMNLIDHLRWMFRVHHQNRHSAAFAKTMDLFIQFRELTEGFLKIYKEMSKDKFLKQHVPEMLDFFFDE